MEHKPSRRHRTQGLALTFCIAVLVGNSLPELGNVAALWLGLHPHFLNIYFLVGGVLGIICGGVACYRGLNRANTVQRMK